MFSFIGTVLYSYIRALTFLNFCQGMVVEVGVGKGLEGGVGKGVEEGRMLRALEQRMFGGVGEVGGLAMLMVGGVWVWRRHSCARLAMTLVSCRSLLLL